QVNVSPGAALAGFQVSINGRFWVSTEVRDAAARHPWRAGAPLAEVAHPTSQPGVAAGDRGASAGARRPAAGHALRTQPQRTAADPAALEALRPAAIEGRRRRAGGRGRCGDGRRRAWSTVPRAHGTVLGGPTQPVPAYAATGRRPTRAAANTCPAVSDDLP